MGPHRKDIQFVALLAEKDAEIEKLKLSLQAHIAHAVRINSRLAWALDSLDSVQGAHASELSAEIKAKEKLRDTLNRYRDIVQVAEIERDQLRDAVIELAEKIELSKDDFTSWSHSRIKIPHLLEPIHAMPTSSHSIASDDDLLAYASGMIKYLRGALATERNAHSTTRKAARARISLLEAQLARRDAELEACIVHAGQPFSHATRAAPLGPDICVPPTSPVPISDMDTFPDRVAAENIVLEAEVEQLAARLAQARLASVPPSAPLLARSDSQQRASASSPDDPVPRMPSCQRDARNFQSKTSTAKQVNRGSSRRRSASHPGGRPTAASNSTAHPGPASMVPEPDRTVRPDDALLDRLDDAVRSRNAHDALDREIAALGSKIDAFTAEKQALLQQVQLEASNAHHVDQHQTPLPVLRPPHVGHNHGHLLEDYDGEMSMDLATPLFPTVLLAGSSDVDNTGFAEPPSSSVPADISPLDLTSTVPLPARPPSTSLHAAGDPPWGPTDTQSGEAAVQELMNIAATTARRGS